MQRDQGQGCKQSSTAAEGGMVAPAEVTPNQMVTGSLWGSIAWVL